MVSKISIVIFMMFCSLKTVHAADQIIISENSSDLEIANFYQQLAKKKLKLIYYFNIEENIYKSMDSSTDKNELARLIRLTKKIYKIAAQKKICKRDMKRLQDVKGEWFDIIVRFFAGEGKRLRDLLCSDHGCSFGNHHELSMEQEEIVIGNIRFQDQNQAFRALFDFDIFFQQYEPFNEEALEFMCASYTQKGLKEVCAPLAQAFAKYKTFERAYFDFGKKHAGILNSLVQGKQTSINEKQNADFIDSAIALFAQAADAIMFFQCSLKNVDKSIQDQVDKELREKPFKFGSIEFEIKFNSSIRHSMVKPSKKSSHRFLSFWHKRKIASKE